MKEITAGITQAGAVAWGALAVAAAALELSIAVVIVLFLLAGLTQLVSLGIVSGTKSRTTTGRAS